MNTELTLSALVSMTPTDFEQFRSDGWFPRRALTDSVMRELLLSASGLRLKCLHRMPVLDTFLINSLLLRADVLDKNRYTLAGLANELAGISVMPGRRP